MDLIRSLMTVAMDPVAIARARTTINNYLSQYEPLALLLTPVMASLVFFTICPQLLLLLGELQHQGFMGFFFSFVMPIAQKIPAINSYIRKQKEEVVKKMKSNKTGNDKRTELPVKGLNSEVIERLKWEKSKDAAWQGRSSGAVYIGGSEMEGHFNILNTAYAMFAHTNPLHTDLFPSVAKFEAEVVAMTASLFGARDEHMGSDICGNMTSGGTESILMAVKATRDYMRATKGIKNPEMVIPQSAHSAYDKAAEYFKIKLWRADVDKDFRADVKSVKRFINRNTIMIVGSAPGFPHGVIDPIEELGALAQKKNICFHVDLCLGGFVLPFARKLDYPIPPFDFTVPGVTSMSVDIHKYGLGPKGTSIVLYRNHDIRKHQFVAVTEWSGGLYISPSMAGSRSGALIAGAWASLMALGMDGFMNATRELMEATNKLKKGISEIPDLYIVGKPDMTVVAFGSKVIDIYKVNDAMTAKGWSLNALQKPSSIHICITLQHVGRIEEFLKDLSASVNLVKQNPGGFEDGMAPIYGAAAKMPDRGTVKDLLVAYMDNTC